MLSERRKLKSIQSKTFVKIGQKLSKFLISGLNPSDITPQVPTDPSYPMLCFSSKQPDHGGIIQGGLSVP